MKHKMIVWLKSGNKIELQLGAEDKSAEECAKIAHEEFIDNDSTSLRIGEKIFITSCIEAVTIE